MNNRPKPNLTLWILLILLLAFPAFPAATPNPLNDHQPHHIQFHQIETPHDHEHDHNDQIPSRTTSATRYPSPTNQSNDLGR